MDKMNTTLLESVCNEIVVVKKSINLPMENGTLIDTAEETRSKPIAISKGFFSGLAKATIFLKDEELCCGVARNAAGSILLSIEGFGATDGFGVGVDSGKRGP